MHRTDEDLQRRAYLIVTLLVLGSLVSVAILRYANGPGSDAMEVFHAIAYPCLVAALGWAVWYLASNRTVGRLMGRFLVVACTVYYLGDQAISLLSYQGPLNPGLYEAHYWKLLVLCLTWPLVYPHRLGVIAAIIVTSITAGTQLYSVVRIVPHGTFYQSLLTVMSSLLELAAALVLVLLLGHIKHDRVQVDREIQTMRRLAQTDPLTDVWNRRRLHDAFHEAIEQGRVPLTVILFDIDSFKEINDRYGHNTGDQVLVTTTHLAQSVLRGEDSIGRWGGEEFIVLCPGTTLGQGMQIAERIREAISSHVFEGVGTITASFGVAQYRHGESVEELVDRADQVLYVAKERGKNCVEAAALYPNVTTT